jgi:hypothetical protein
MCLQNTLGSVMEEIMKYNKCTNFETNTKAALSRKYTRRIYIAKVTLSSDLF